MRPGLHLSNGARITPADEDIVRRWSPLSALLAMDPHVEDEAEIGKLIRLWELGGRPLLVLRKYIDPESASRPNMWGVHATEMSIMARRCMARGVPAGKIALKPFNEPNMPRHAQWEGFGDQPEDIETYGRALNRFIDVAKNEEPDVLIGGPHLTVGNHDVRFPNDPAGRYYYGPESLCQDALKRLDLHFVHCYGFRQGQYADPAHGLRFLEYEKFLPGKPIVIVEGCYGIQTASGGSIDPAQNDVRGQDTVAYLKLLDQYPQVKGITLWIGGNTGWQEHRHSENADAGSHRPVVFHVERYVNEGPQPEPGPGLEPPPPEPEVKIRAYRKDGSAVDPQVLFDEYNVVIRPCEGAGFKVVEIWERCEAANCDVWVKGSDGGPTIGRPVRWGWPGTEIRQLTEYEGRVGFPMSRDAYYDPATDSGPHWTAVEGNSDSVDGIGMVVGTVHCTLNFVFQWMEAAPEPAPEPPSPPEPGPEPDVPYRLITGLNRRLKAAGLPSIIDVRSEIEAAYVTAPQLTRGLGPDDLQAINLHHVGKANYVLNVMALARLHIKTNGWPNIAPHFCVEKDGQAYFTKKLAIHGPQAGNSQANRYGISIEVNGRFDINPATGRPYETPIEAQLTTLGCIVQEIERFVGGGWGKCHPLPIVPHRCVTATACPGCLYEEFRRRFL